MARKPSTVIENFAFGATRWVGSLLSIGVHTVLFAGSFVAAWLHLIPLDRMLLVLTTIVSLEAIYLAIFIQMSLNHATETIEEVEQDIDEIQKDVDEIQEDVDEIQKDVDEIQEDVDEIQEDVDEIQEDVEELSEEEKSADAVRVAATPATLEEIHTKLLALIRDIEKIQRPQ